MISPNLKRTAVSATLCATLFLSACSGGSGESGGGSVNPLPTPYVYAPPQDIGDLWTVERADKVGVAIPQLEAMINALRQGQYPIVDSIAVARRGKLVLAETIRSKTDDSDKRVNNTDPELHVQNSASKSFASALIGVAIDQGLIDGTDVPYLSLFPYSGYANPDDRKYDMNLHDVLAMRLGLDWNEWNPPYSDPANQLFTFYATQVDLSKGLLDLPVAFDPGTRFAYNTVASVSLGQAVENSAPLSLIDFGAANVLAPLGIGKIEAEQTRTGLPDLGRGLFLTSRDLLKLGQVYLDNGKWQGRVIVSDDWVSRSTTAYSDLAWADPDNMAWQIEGYGYQWWIGSFDVDGRKVHSFAAWGFGEQWLMVIPEFELVVAVNSHGKTGSAAESNQVLSLIRRFILEPLAAQPGA